MLVKELGSVGNTDTSTSVLREIRWKKTPSASTPLVHDVVQEEPPPPEPLVIQARYESYGLPPDWALDERHLDYMVAERYGIRWDHGWIIPIWAPRNGPLLGWQYKRLDIVANWPKKVKKSTTLFGLRELTATTAAVAEVAIVESPLDVVRLAWSPCRQ